MKTNRPQADYCAMENGFQLAMPLNCERTIGKNAPVRLLNAVMERIDYRKVYAEYSRLGRIEYSPKILIKIIVYGCMRKPLSGRALEACAAKTCTSSNCRMDSVRRIIIPSISAAGIS